MAILIKGLCIGPVAEPVSHGALEGAIEGKVLYDNLVKVQLETLQPAMRLENLIGAHNKQIRGSFPGRIWPEGGVGGL